MSTALSNAKRKGKMEEQTTVTDGSE